MDCQHQVEWCNWHTQRAGSHSEGLRLGQEVGQWKPHEVQQDHAQGHKSFSPALPGLTLLLISTSLYPCRLPSVTSASKKWGRAPYGLYLAVFSDILMFSHLYSASVRVLPLAAMLQGNLFSSRFSLGGRE